MPYPKDPIALARWEHNLTSSLAQEPAAWHQYDSVIQVTVSEYNQFLRKTPGYSLLDWRFIKAMCWIESGAYNPAWKRNPMQIGAFRADAGMKDILSSQQGKLVLPPKYALTLNMANVPVIPTCNIQAGTGYMLERMARFGQIHSFLNSTTLPQRKSLSGAAAKSAFNRFEREQERYPYSLFHQFPTSSHNENTNDLVGEFGLEQSASRKHLERRSIYGIVGWRVISFDSIAHRYNGGGDGNYADKLAFAWGIIAGSTNN